MKAPTKSPKTFEQAYAFLAHPEPYDGEEDCDFQSRKNLLDAFEKQMIAQGVDIAVLKAIDTGIILGGM